MRRLRYLLGVALFAGVASAYGAETCSQTASRPSGALPMCVAIDAATSTGASSTVDTFGHRLLRAQVWSSAGSVASVLIQARSSSSAPWYTVATVTDPSATGEYWSVPRCYQMRVNVSTYGSGTISATIERYKD